MEPQMNSGHRPDLEMNLDRPRRVRAAITYWVFLLAVAALLAFLMLRFTGSKVIAFSLSGGMLAYMLFMSAVTSKNLSKGGGGRLD